MFREEILKQRIKAKRALPPGYPPKRSIKAKGALSLGEIRNGAIKATGERFAPARAISEIGAKTFFHN